MNSLVLASIQSVLAKAEKRRFNTFTVAWSHTIKSIAKTFLKRITIDCQNSFAGTIVSDADECSSTTDCLENERCSYNPANSRYECTCNPGFSMVDGRCVVSDCSTNPSQCHVNAQCVSTGEGGYKCVCIEGYNGDGVRQCVENHIGCNVLNNCGRNAVCGYNQTSANFACVCQPVCLLNPQIRPELWVSRWNWWDEILMELLVIL